MEEAVEEAVDAELMETVWEAVLTNSEIKEYPEEQLEAEIDELYAYYQKGAEVYEMEFDVFLDEVMGLTEEEFVASLQAAAETNVKNDLIVELICEKEKLSMTEEEMLEAQEALAKEMGYADVPTMLEDAGADAVEKYILRDMVKEWLVDNCIQVND
jgi:trigger factor